MLIIVNSSCIHRVIATAILLHCGPDWLIVAINRLNLISLDCYGGRIDKSLALTSGSHAIDLILHPVIARCFELDNSLL